MALTAAPLVGIASAAGTPTPSGSLALTVLPQHTTVASGGMLRATLTVTSTGAGTATAVSTCLVPPPQLTVAQATGAARRGRSVCFTVGDLPAGQQAARAVSFRAVADRTVNVRLLARASSTCQCSGRPSAMSPVVRITRAPAARPRVTG